jgi:hypothetical protein
VFENRRLRKLFGPKRDEMMGRLEKTDDEDLHDLYSLPNVIRTIKLRRVEWAEHVA